MGTPVQVARRLLGQRLVRSADGLRTAGIIVETEAYLGVEDKAAHSFGGRQTPRTRTMFAIGGTGYVYLNYGLHRLVNVVVGPVGRPQAVLIRALEPTEGVAEMRLRRPQARLLTELCSGPGKLGAALAVDLTLDGCDLCLGEELFLERVRRRCHAEREIVTTTRIGVEYAEEWAAAPLRFYLRDNPHVSRR